MLTTCSRCRRRDYCENCTKQEDCYWLKAIPPEGGGRGCPVNHSSAGITRTAERLKQKIGN